MSRGSGLSGRLVSVQDSRASKAQRLNSATGEPLSSQGYKWQAREIAIDSHRHTSIRVWPVESLALKRCLEKSPGLATIVITWTFSAILTY